MGCVSSTDRRGDNDEAAAVVVVHAEDKVYDGVVERDVDKIREGMSMGLPDLVWRKSVRKRSECAESSSLFEYAVEQEFVSGVELMLEVCMLSFNFVQLQTKQTHI